MNKTEKMIKKELESGLERDSGFDLSALPDNPKPKKKGKRAIVLTTCVALALVLVIGVSAPLVAASFRITNSFGYYKKSYTAMEYNLIESSSFKNLNSIDYPSGEKTNYAVGETYKTAVTNFANAIYSSASKDDSNGNFSFSPLGLYVNLSLLALASNDSDTLSALDAVLGMSRETRSNELISTYKNDFFVNTSGTMQMYNASFQSANYNVNYDYINALTEHYAEAYSLDFGNSSDVAKMLNWVDAKVNEKNYLTADDLEIDVQSALYMITTLYFDNKWYNTFNASSSYSGDFHLANGECAQTTFMKHTYLGDCYDYGDYVACYDYYRNGMKIKYLVPKSADSDIATLTEGTDILTDDTAKKMVPPADEYGNVESLIVNLSVPKFTSEYSINFSETLKTLGLSRLFNPTSNSFNYAFSDLPDGTSIYLSFVKQKNKVAFDEEGTTIKSVTYSGLKAGSAAPMTGNTIDITLDCPYIYIIYDSNDLPVYIGNVNNPTI